MIARIKRSFVYGFWLQLRMNRCQAEQIALLERQVSLLKKMVAELEHEARSKP